MASNKAATAVFIAALAMIFAVEVALAHGHGGVFTDHHFLHRHTKPPPCADSVRHYKVNGFDFKMEKGHEACYIACYNNVFVSESSPFTAEKRCHKKCSSGGVSMFSASAIATATHTISSSVTPNHGIFYTSTAAEKPAAFSSTSAAAEKPAVSSAGTAAEKPAISSTDTAAEKPAVSSTGPAAEKPSVSSTDTAAEKPAISSTDSAIEKPTVSSAGTAAEAPVVSSIDNAAEAPAVWSANTEETNFGNPYS